MAGKERWLTVTDPYERAFLLAHMNESDCPFTVHHKPSDTVLVHADQMRVWRTDQDPERRNRES